MDKFYEKSAKLKIILAVSVTVLLFIIGLAFFARPTISENEKRELTKFPKFTFESFLSGEYTSQVSLWYSDSYPGRDAMLDMNGDIKSLYGVHDVAFEGGVEADTIDPNEDFTMPEFVTRPSEDDTGNGNEAGTGFEEETAPPEGQVIDVQHFPLFRSRYGCRQKRVRLPLKQGNTLMCRTGL